MLTTSVSLLKRLATNERDDAWQRFVELYAPLIYHWTLRAGLAGADAADCAQEVMTALVAKLPTFAYDPTRSFRGWLRTVTTNQCRDMLRRQATVADKTAAFGVDELTGPSDLDLFDDEEYRCALVHRALEIMQAEFEPLTAQACWEHVTTGEPAAVIGRRLGMSENAVYLAKSRVLRRLREELDGMLS